MRHSRFPQSPKKQASGTSCNARARASQDTRRIGLPKILGTTEVYPLPLSREVGSRNTKVPGVYTFICTMTGEQLKNIEISLFARCHTTTVVPHVLPRSFAPFWKPHEFPHFGRRRKVHEKRLKRLKPRNTTGKRRTKISDFSKSRKDVPPAFNWVQASDLIWHSGLKIESFQSEPNSDWLFAKPTGKNG